METKECAKCHGIKPLTDFTKHGKYYMSYCHDCRLIVQKISRDKHKDKAKDDYERLRDSGYYRERHKKLVQSGFFNEPIRHQNNLKLARKVNHNPEHAIKRKARQVIKYMIKSGRLLKEPCFLCGNPIAEAHHPNYNNPRYVVFLCDACHGLMKYKAYKIIEYPPNQQSTNESGN